VHDEADKRKPKKISRNYLYYPNELQKEKELRMSYLGIDTDNSDSLEFTEILEMFNENKIDIKMSEVKQIFKPYDLDKDGALNFLEFK